MNAARTLLCVFVPRTEAPAESPPATLAVPQPVSFVVVFAVPRGFVTHKFSGRQCDHRVRRERGRLRRVVFVRSLASAESRALCAHRDHRRLLNDGRLVEAVLNPPTLRVKFHDFSHSESRRMVVDHR